MSQRSSTPRSRPSSASRPGSARRRSASPQSDGKITVYIYNVHSSDKLVLRIFPHLEIGPAASEASVETSSRPSLKSEIAQSLGIDAMQIRLMFHGTPLGDDEKTLKCYGVADGETVQLRLQKHCAAGRNDVILASAKKKCGEHAEWDKDEMLCMRPFAMQPQSARARLSNRCAQNGAALMPKWVSQEHPKLFAPVGIGIDGHSGDRAYEEFSHKGIWTPPADHPNMRGQNQFGLQRVREGAHRAHARGSVGGA